MIYWLPFNDEIPIFVANSVCGRKNLTTVDQKAEITPRNLGPTGKPAECLQKKQLGQGSKLPVRQCVTFQSIDNPRRFNTCSHESFEAVRARFCLGTNSLSSGEIASSKTSKKHQISHQSGISGRSVSSESQTDIALNLGCYASNHSWLSASFARRLNFSGKKSWFDLWF